MSGGMVSVRRRATSRPSGRSAGEEAPASWRGKLRAQVAGQRGRPPSANTRTRGESARGDGAPKGPTSRHGRSPEGETPARREGPSRRNSRIEPREVDAEGSAAGTEATPKARTSWRERWASWREGWQRFGRRARKPVVVLGRIAFSVSLLAASFGVYRLVDRYVRTSPAFATATIDVQGQERVSREAIVQGAGLELGQNVFAISPAQAAAKLRQQPWIADAQVERRLPKTFTVRVREHRPVALLALDRLYLVSEEGAVFKAAEPTDPVDLPVINGVDQERFADDRTYRTAIVLEVVALLHEYRSVGLWRREPIAEVAVEEDEGFSLFIGKDTTNVRLGRAPHREKLRRLRAILDQVAERKARPAYVYLDNPRRPNRVTARLRDPRGG